MGGQRLSLLTDCGSEANAVVTNLLLGQAIFVASACFASRHGRLGVFHVIILSFGMINPSLENSQKPIVKSARAHTFRQRWCMRAQSKILDAMARGDMYSLHFFLWPGESMGPHPLKYEGSKVLVDHAHGPLARMTCSDRLCVNEIPRFPSRST